LDGGFFCIAVKQTIMFGEIRPIINRLTPAVAIWVRQSARVLLKNYK